MFSRSNWSIFGIESTHANAFIQSLDDRTLMLYWSEVVAKALARNSSFPAVGVNPWYRPRLDDDEVLTPEVIEALAAFRGVSAPDRLPHVFEAVKNLYASGAIRFEIAPSKYGFWFCFNEWRDVGDAASAREDLAYRMNQAPYKLLDTQSKKVIDQSFRATAEVMRRQFPVFVDLRSGLIFAETTSKNHIAMLRDWMEALGAPTYAMAWRFGEGDWIRPLLERLATESRFKEAFRKRAEQRTHLAPAMIDKLDNAELEKVVSNFFVTSELETEEWLSLGTPAEIQLYRSADRVVATSPTNATLLLEASRDALIASAQVTAQRRISTFSKQGEERTFRRDLYRLVLNDSINDVEAGVALLRGFDLPNFKRDAAREKRRTKVAPTVKSLWADWLDAMEAAVWDFSTNVQTLLGLFDRACGVDRLYPAPEQSADSEPLITAERIAPLKTLVYEKAAG